MARLAFLVAMFIVVGYVTLRADEQRPNQEQKPVADKLPVPDDAARAKALAIVRQVFKVDYGTRKPENRRSLVRKLLKQADDPANDATMRYVLLTEAAQIAAKAGDAQTALDAAAKKSLRFEDDPLRLKLDVLSMASRAVVTSEYQASLVAKWTSLANEGVSAEAFDLAKMAARCACNAARKSKNKALVLCASQELHRIEAMAKLFAAMVESKAKLKVNPDDPKANLTLGRYLCFVEGQWDEGLTFLAKVDIADLKATAEADLAAPEAAKEQVAIADEWYQLAKQERDPLGRASLQARARYWYKLSLPKLAGMERAKIETRLAEIRLPNNFDPKSGKVAARGNRNSDDQDDKAIRVAPLLLLGVQREAVLQLRRATRPHRLTGKFIVPQGKRLEIKAGTIIECERGSELSISGEIVVRGTADKHVFLRGWQGNVGGWAGIHLNHTANARIEYAEVRDAEVGIAMLASQCTMKGCILVHNRVGLKLTAYGSGSQATLDDCVIAFNEKDGVLLDGSDVTIDGCTIANNGGWGIQGYYYGNHKICHSIVSLNKGGGIHCIYYECKLVAEKSVLAGNAGIDIKNESSGNWDLRGNFWGKELTKVLRARGPTVKLPNIVGLVRLDGFLDRVPKRCGASVRTLDKRKIW